MRSQQTAKGGRSETTAIIKRTQKKFWFGSVSPGYTSPDVLLPDGVDNLSKVSWNVSILSAGSFRDWIIAGIINTTATGSPTQADIESSNKFNIYVRNTGSGATGAHIVSIEFKTA